MKSLDGIGIGDQVSFYCARIKSTKTRTVRLINDEFLTICYDHEMLKLYPDQIKSVLKCLLIRKANETDLSKEMRRKNVTNAGLAEKAGYSTRAVCDARLGRRVKAVTLSDIRQALAAI